MGFTKAFKITREPRTFQAGESTGFQLSLGAQYYDRKSQSKQWANYKAVVFAKGNQLNFYQSALVFGTVVELSADDLKIDNYNPEYLAIELIDARLGGVFTGNSPQQQGNLGQPQKPQKMPSQHQHQQQSQPQGQYNEPPCDFDDDIPF